MAARDLAVIVLVGGAGYLVFKALSQGNPDGTPVFNLLPDLTSPSGGWNMTNNPFTEMGDYFVKLAKAENAKKDPYVKAKTSSASGLWQFTKATWKALGGQWGEDLTKAFGGLKPTVAEQNAAIAKLTDQNRHALVSAGIAATNGALYAAHFLGAPTAVKVLRGAPTAMVSVITGPAVVKANPFLASMTVADFGHWLQRKVG